jgi:hypothetical protein
MGRNNIGWAKSTFVLEVFNKRCRKLVLANMKIVVTFKLKESYNGIAACVELTAFSSPGDSSIVMLSMPATKATVTGSQCSEFQPPAALCAEIASGCS